ncbi:uncharacterized protein MYCFIDRAFT_58458 [Pseudocercospora fijiensis CIRAD86]|uniref:Queuosine 5'-phosphate N-glycosylase/hydrolase n=1 Tax=Pseudocercospora fijiensis (strain CIRAD86) TaxID=383855 RepID=M2ZGS7_PSEFD|nr:uncharacterized protein MYCFIDRAFT_58458 [Pseudocercospora fijiensis CIRAD86]EME78329.1 hypothetical protein MYCFIDRAFT_58458 [Pseudocercospora fijiensis CIRAD86]
MSDDEADPELLELLRQRLGISSRPRDEISSDTGVLRNAEFIYNNAIDVSIDMYGTKAAAESIYQMMQERGYSTETWSQHELHPKMSEGFTELDIVNFVFTMDLQNYSFWSELPSEERYQVEYRGRRWTGYNSLVACLRRALDEGIPITTPRFWRSRQCTDELLRRVFRSATAEPIPLLDDRIEMLRESSDILRRQPDYAVMRLIQKSDGSAGKLVNLLAHHFPCFRDETRFEGRRVRLLKRAQILVADLWAALNGSGLGELHDIDHLTMFAGANLIALLYLIDCLVRSWTLSSIREGRSIQHKQSQTLEYRSGCSIWAVELIRREILSSHHEATNINAVLIDFFLYDLAKERDRQGQHAIPHHRTRSIWY